MESVRDLNMDADEMQVVLSAIRSVNTSPCLAVNTSSQARRCASGCTSALAPCRTIGTGRLSPIRSLLGRYSISLRIWRKYY